ncbi:pyruvate dehydrogenase complex E1 component subunit beta [Streptomyces sp. NBC_00035]|uniref:alpha-ketoacid dehydrogenase subunit alpha/beta n=1 Tax=Streptomyces sp. NBC_00035 TaxID=2903614 RepID=UPI00324D0507
MVTSVSEAPAAQAEVVVELYRRMRLIREFETRTSALYKAGEVPGFVHLSIGQEATAVGACRHLREDDVVTSTHRGHGHCLAKGLGADQMMAELMGRDSGTCHGRGGSMHIADPKQGIFGANGIVGAGLPIAVGAATAAQLRGADSVVVSFFGDGAVAQGMFHEAVNLAGVWDLPVVFFCENNQYAEFSRASDQHRATLKERAIGYGVPYRRVDGNDVIAVADVMDNVIAHTRAGHGPFLVEAFTYRWHGHYEGDPEHYRTGEELASWRERDPLNLAYDRALAAGATSDALIEVDVAVRAEIDAAVEHARQAEAPKPASLFDFVTAPRPDIPEPPAPSGEPVKMMAAIREAIEREMTDDPSVFMAGIDVAQGNVFGLFRGMADAFPGRVRDTPISETAIVGTAVGAALAGFRPVVEIMYMDFIGVCLDGLMNQAAKLRFMTGGRASLPLVVRTQFGAGRSSGSQHSQSLEAVLAHIPGLTVVMPSNPADAYGLMRAAIRDPNPVVFIENRLQYGMKGPGPEPDHLVPLGRAKVVREGRDVSVVSWSRMLTTVLQAADRLAEEGISAEVIDLRTISPLDRETVLRSLERTHRLVIVHEAVQDFGVGAELAALAANEGFWHLDAPVARVAPPAIPSPYAPSLEKLWLPDADAIADTVRRVVRS